MQYVNQKSAVGGARGTCGSLNKRCCSCLVGRLANRTVWERGVDNLGYRPGSRQLDGPEEVLKSLL